MTSIGETTRPTLLARLMNFLDRAAYDEFQRIYVPIITCFCRKWRLDEDEVADVVQDVLTVIISRKGFKYDPSKGSFRGWLFMTTMGMIHRLWEKCARAGRGGGGDGAEPALAALESPHAEADWNGTYFARVLEVALERVKAKVVEAKWQAFFAVAVTVERLDGGKVVHHLCPGKAQDGVPARVAASLGMSVNQVQQAKCEVLKLLEQEILDIAEEHGPLDLVSEPGAEGSRR